MAEGMKLKTATFEVEIKYKPAGNELLINEPQIRMKTVEGKPVQKVRVVAKNTFQWKGKNLATELKLIDPETQKEVPLSEALEILDNYKYKYLAEDGTVLLEEDIVYWEVKPDGTEEERSPYGRTHLIDASKEENWIPSTAVEGFLVHQVYEIYSEDKKVAIHLFEEAEKRLKADQIYITTFSFGGFKAYYVFLCPMFKDGKFVWLLKFTEQKLAWNHLQDPPVAPKVPIREAPTVQTLPPIAALLIVPAERKKKK